jgi:hypothetical protein
VATAYSDRKAKPIPVIHEPQLPANTALLFAMDMPQLARYFFNDVAGPHMLVLPEATNYDVALVFDLFTLDDPQEASRHLMENVGA